MNSNRSQILNIAKQFYEDLYTPVASPPPEWNELDHRICQKWTHGSENHDDTMQWCLNDVHIPSGVAAFSNKQNKWSIFYMNLEFTIKLTHPSPSFIIFLFLLILSTLWCEYFVVTFKLWTNIWLMPYFERLNV